MMTIIKERIILALALATIGILLIDRYRPKNEKGIKFDWDRLWIFKTHSEQKYSHVVCGDSRVYRDVSASAMEKNLSDGSVFNFGYSSGSFSNFMLDRMERKLDKNSRHPTLILGITPFSLTKKASVDAHIKEELARKKEEVIEVLYMEPLKRVFEPISIELLVNGHQGDLGNEPVYHQEPFYKEGWVASSKTPPDPKSALPSYVKSFEGNTVSLSMIDSLLLRVRAWREKGITVYGFRPPTTFDMVELEYRLSGFNEKDFQTRFENAGGVWLSFSSTDFETYDGSHLTKSSAIKFSEQLGKLIKTRESGNRN